MGEVLLLVSQIIVTCRYGEKLAIELGLIHRKKQRSIGWTGHSLPLPGYFQLLFQPNLTKRPLYQTRAGILWARATVSIWHSSVVAPNVGQCYKPGGWSFLFRCSLELPAPSAAAIEPASCKIAVRWIIDKLKSIVRNIIISWCVMEINLYLACCTEPWFRVLWLIYLSKVIGRTSVNDSTGTWLHKQAKLEVIRRLIYK